MNRWIKAEKGAWIVFFCLLAGILLPTYVLVVAAAVVAIWLAMRGDDDRQRPA